MIAIVACCATPGFAAELKQGDLVKPVGALPLRAAPPDALIGLKGDEVGTADPTKEYRVLDKRTIKTLFGQQDWMLIQGTAEDKKGWVYSGDATGPQNLRPAN
jgi:hypothetical protein